jgi:hypothetical protein
LTQYFRTGTPCACHRDPRGARGGRDHDSRRGARRSNPLVSARGLIAHIPFFQIRGKRGSHARCPGQKLSRPVALTGRLIRRSAGRSAVRFRSAADAISPATGRFAAPSPKPDHSSLPRGPRDRAWSPCALNAGAPRLASIRHARTTIHSRSPRPGAEPSNPPVRGLPSQSVHRGRFGRPSGRWQLDDQAKLTRERAAPTGRGPAP